MLTRSSTLAKLYCDSCDNKLAIDGPITTRVSCPLCEKGTLWNQLEINRTPKETEMVSPFTIHTYDWCRANIDIKYEESIRHSVVGPLKMAKRLEVPENVWSNIRSGIEVQTVKADVSALIEKAATLFRRRKLVLAVSDRS